ncbi:conserved hypothetical protein [Rhodococcus jostii RHA1]|uniref:Uncharacterized protein n=1 Tax=Rhodococcus jostii (strain RHA1) TaxID=101510 RepID=Q0SBH7_RHOJR|nr:conserved hypothetical protein [Rhodococcus jostii RHA1]
MTTTPDRVRTAFPEISSRAWEHPADRAALVTLRTLKGFDTVFRTISGLLQERQHRLMYLATSVRVDERQFSDLHDLRSDCVRILGADETPSDALGRDHRLDPDRRVGAARDHRRAHGMAA